MALLTGGREVPQCCKPAAGAAVHPVQGRAWPLIPASAALPAHSLPAYPCTLARRVLLPGLATRYRFSFSFTRLLAHSVPVCQCTRARMPRPPPWPGHSFPLSASAQPACLLMSTSTHVHACPVLLPGLATRQPFSFSSTCPLAHSVPVHTCTLTASSSLAWLSLAPFVTQLEHPCGVTWYNCQ